nr:unnamed protein product [Haemonchus contortus]
MGLLPRTTIQCFLWCYAIVSYFSLAEERERIFCYANDCESCENGFIRPDDDPAAICLVYVKFNIMNGTTASPVFNYDMGWGELNDPLECEMWDGETEILHPKDENEFLQYNGEMKVACYCNQTAICATQPETFEGEVPESNRRCPRCYARNVTCDLQIDKKCSLIEDKNIQS